MGIYAEVVEVEKHLHTGERWFGSTAGDTPALLTSITPFVIVSGAASNQYGAAKEIMDGSESLSYPFAATKFDPHKILIVTNTSDGKLWKFQFANSNWNGESHEFASMDEAIAANNFSEGIVKIDTFKSNSVAVIFQTGRANVGSKLWARVKNDEASNSSISILIGLHGYLV